MGALTVPDRRFHFLSCVVEVDTPTGETITLYSDGAKHVSNPRADADYLHAARRLGYSPDDAGTRQFCVEHDLLLHMLAESLGEHRSDVMWALAHGHALGPSAAKETDRAFGFQKYLRTGSDADCVAILSQLARLKDEAIELLRPVSVRGVADVEVAEAIMGA